MPLQVYLLFHFNQHLNDNARLASQVCYRGLLGVLRRHPRMRFNLHISGTLLHALTWLDPEPIELIRSGLAAGHFELLGSTYAQNIPYATGDSDNLSQINLHRETLAQFFNVEPTTFWNPERCWRQTLVPLIAGAGYDTTLIESHILEASGAPEPVTFLTRAGSSQLKIVRDEEKLIDLINYAAWFGGSEPALRYLITAAGGGARCMAYAEDAEAMGLWGFGKGLDPQATWDNLDRFLTRLSSLDGIETGFLRDAPAPTREVTPIADGSATWMDASLRDPALPYHEQGYQDWFDFNRRSEKLASYRQFYAGIQKKLAEPHPQGPRPGAENLASLARHTYLAHQYEFGCIGIGHPAYRGWRGAQASLVLDRASRWARLGHPLSVSEDINDDGVMEYCLSDGKNLLITTPLGGRLLYWIDLEHGRVRIGSPLSVGYGPHTSDAAFPDGAPISPLEPATLDLDRPTRLVTEEPPTRMGPFLDPWIWTQAGGPHELSIYETPLQVQRQRLPIQVRGFSDEFRCGEALLFAPGTEMQAYQVDRSIVFTQVLAPELFLEKRYRLTRTGAVEVDYAWSNTGAEKITIDHLHCSEINLDLAALLDHGPSALRFSNRAGEPTLTNPVSGECIVLRSTFPPVETFMGESLLARTLGLRARIDLYPGVFWQTSLSLTLEQLPQV